MTWFCSQCFNDVEGSVWDGLDKESGRVLCQACRAAHNSGPEHHCQECV